MKTKKMHPLMHSNLLLLFRLLGIATAVTQKCAPTAANTSQLNFRFPIGKNITTKNQHFLPNCMPLFSMCHWSMQSL